MSIDCSISTLAIAGHGAYLSRMITSPQPLVDEPRHPIAVVVERTGLSPDLIRAWERRYGAVMPVRGSGGHRLYTSGEIERLRLLRAAVQGGRTIGHVATASTDELRALIDEDSLARELLVPTPATRAIDRQAMDAAMAAARAYDMAVLEDTMQRSLALHGAVDFLELVAVPLLRLAGDEWHAGRMSPAEEHLLSSVVHDVVVGAMRGFRRRDGSPGILVTTPVGSRHVIGAALIGAAVALEGWNVIYLGADLPAECIVDAVDVSGVEVVALSIVYSPANADLPGELQALRAQLPSETMLVVGGAATTALQAQLRALGIRVESDIPGLIGLLRRKRAGDSTC